MDQINVIIKKVDVLPIAVAFLYAPLRGLNSPFRAINKLSVLRVDVDYR